MVCNFWLFYLFMRFWNPSMRHEYHREEALASSVISLY